ncbi:hypothetical protein HK097_006928 [Rhizophlyctis rosea]|uniref:Uncharacterized protein n=1 Tax=Rhizophlyctis rosea TaxID=64517 RepID=A0AAD5X4P0_9FUNG|nr:hypothetical protein HK097_006928 [Rhizophlyctis rosea]
MFYRTARNDNALNLLDDAAHVVAALPDLTGADIEDFVALCSQQLLASWANTASPPDENNPADVSNGEQPTAPRPDLLCNKTDQLGVLGALEYIISSPLDTDDETAALRNELIDRCLDACQILPSLASEHVGNSWNEDHSLVEKFTHGLISRFIGIAFKFADSRQNIYRSVWTWSTELLSILITSGTRATILEPLSLLFGFLTAFKSSSTQVPPSEISNLNTLLSAILAPPFLKHIRTALKEDRRTERDTSEEPDGGPMVIRVEKAGGDAGVSVVGLGANGRYDALTLVMLAFDAVQHVMGEHFAFGEETDEPSVVAERISADNEEVSTWDKIATRPITSKLGKLDLQRNIGQTYEDCWNSGWRSAVAGWDDSETADGFVNVGAGNGDASGVDALVPAAIRAATYCVLHLGESPDDFVGRVALILTDKGDVPFLEEVRLDLYLTALEALECVARNIATSRPAITEIVLQFLSDPSPLFATFVDDISLNVLRQCASEVLKSCLALQQSSTVTQGCVYALIRSTRGAAGLGGGGLTTGEVVGVENALVQNGIVGLAGIAGVVKSREVRESIIPALTRLSGKTAYDDAVWEALGNVGLVADIDVFRDVVAIVIDEGKHGNRISKISHSLARMSARRPPIFANYYLEKILALFVDRAAALVSGTADSTLLQLLRDLAVIVKIICEQPSFSLPNPLSDELINLFRNFWIYNVLYVLLSNGTWPAEWQSALASISVRTPVLVLGKGEKGRKGRGAVEADVGGNSVLRGKFGEGVMTRIRTILLTLLPHYAVEMLRVRKGGIAPIKGNSNGISVGDTMLKYITEERLAGSDVWNVIEGVGDEVR